MNSRRTSVLDGLFADNTILSALMVISPVIVCGNTLKNAGALIYAFSVITFLSVVIASFVPKKIPYTLRVIIYAIISSLIYIPVRLVSESFYPEAVSRIGIYFPLIAVNSLIIFQTENKFFKMKKVQMILSLIFYILGFDVVMIFTAFVRELFAYGTINNKMTNNDTLIAGLGQPFGGFIFLGLLCGIYRKLRSAASGEEYYNSKDGGSKNVSDK